MTVKVDRIYTPDTSTDFERPLFMASVPAGFPSPADDYVEAQLDLNKLLVKHSSATFFVRVSGHSMTGAGIYDKDLLIVDRALEAVDGKVVIAVVDGDLTVKRIRQIGNKLLLVPDNADYDPLQISEEMDFEVWGVVTNVIHSV